MSARRAVYSLLALCTLAAQLAGAQSVTVQPKDTLWSIAQRSGTTVDTLRQLNDLTSDHIVPGQVLRLPVSEADLAAAENRFEPAVVTSVIVKPGDTLYDIALAHGISVSDLIAYNSLEGHLIHPGLELLLVAGERQLEPLYVTIAPGDNLWALARRFDTTVAAIAEANHLGTSDIIKPGDRLAIPGSYASNSQDLGGAIPEEIVVAPGESLWGLANRHGTSVAAIMSANNLASDRLVAGQTLRILPGTEVAAGRAIANLPTAPVVSTSALVWPIEGIITSRFGFRQLRVSGSNFHAGLDIDGDSGDPIRAARGGIVTFSGWQGGYGYLVVIENGETEYYYAHASALLVDVGDLVEAGHVIARVGSTGNSTGSHLHFEVRVNGDPIDPLPILEAGAQR